MAGDGESARLSLSEERMLRLLAEFKIELLRDLDTRFKEVATAKELHALEQRTGEALDAVRAVAVDHESRLQALEQTDAAARSLDVFRRWAIPVCIGLLIALAPHITFG
jgi:hypothetical protein